MARLIVTFVALVSLSAPARDAGVVRGGTDGFDGSGLQTDFLPPLARQLLHRRMQRHGDEMIHLVVAVTLLKRDAVRNLAQEIADEPRITRPMPGDEDALNAALPERFFVLQDELRSRAKALANIARGTDDAELANGLGQLTQACVACHSTFRTTEKPAATP